MFAKNCRTTGIAMVLLSVVLSACSSISQNSATTPRAAAASALAESDDYIIAAVAAGDTYEGLAERYLGHASKSWMIEDYNDNQALTAGQPVVIPKKFWNPAGVYPNGYQLVPILCYHDIGPVAKGRLLIGEKTFQEQMRYLKDNGFRTVTLGEYHEFLNQKRQLPKKTVMVTFDDGYKSFMRHAYPILKELGFTATLFVYTDYLGAGGNALTWPDLKKLSEEGFQIEAHTKSHGDLRRGPGETVNSHQERLRNELEVPLPLFQKNLGNEVKFLAYPYGAQNEEVVERTRKAGYLAAFTVRPQSSYAFIDPYRIHRVQIFSEFRIDQFANFLNVFHEEVLQ